MYKSYKYCVVPECTNTTFTAPDKHFFWVPQDPKIRKKWCSVINRKKSVSWQSSLYCCEDHFDIKNDMENYVKYKLVGGKLKLKKNVLPHKFLNCEHSMKEATDESEPEEPVETKPIEYLECKQEPDFDERYFIDSSGILWPTSPADKNTGDHLRGLIEYADDTAQPTCRLCKLSLQHAADIGPHIVEHHPKLAEPDTNVSNTDNTQQDVFAEIEIDIKGKTITEEKNKRKRPTKSIKPTNKSPKRKRIQQDTDTTTPDDKDVITGIEIKDHKYYKEPPKNRKRKIKRPAIKTIEVPVPETDPHVNHVDANFGKHVEALMKGLPAKVTRQLQIDIIKLVYNVKEKHRLII